ncbi:hypothetical protein F477_02423 [Pseudomonas sp. URIL14HWK12:I3]|uniref:hypothetical protein n=1 Tax=unclassified Pseudomonas TaxID=196821 RepID=UPI000DAD6450|nr:MULTISPECIES: hypothetical protein [unclassified Pseudomonas]PZW48219.1 hypothetical protein F478_04040 [Pseudomonas sp. URIL14HWK12:I2]PZW56716.1 hypothetical protein F477_02423 [Pseudomonas sp. URIL14HWK12:I3]
MSLTNHKHAALHGSLTRTADNAAFYAALTIAGGVSDIGETAGYSAEPNYRLIRVDRQLDSDSVDEFEIALVNDVEFSVIYYTRVTLIHIPEISNRNIAEHLFWRSANMCHSEALRDISQKVLLGYIAQRYELLLTEDAALGDGKFYWHRQVSRALELGFHVFSYDGVTQALRPIPSQRALIDLQDQAWSCACPQSLRALISIFPLPR